MGRPVLLVLGCIFAAIYVRHYMQVAPEVRILQSSISNPTIPDALRELCPLVIDESLVDPMSLCASTLKYQYVWRRTRTIDSTKPGAWHRCTARFTIVWCAGHAASIDVRNPRLPDNVVRIRLRADQPLILPPAWWCQLVAPDPAAARHDVRLRACETYDILHLVLLPVASLLLGRSSRPSAAGVA